MPVHFIHDLGQENLVTPFAPAEAVCGRRLREAHEITRPDRDADICTECLTWSRRNKFQNFRCAVEMSAEPAGAGSEESFAVGGVSAEV